MDSSIIKLDNVFSLMYVQPQAQTLLVNLLLYAKYISKLLEIISYYPEGFWIWIASRFKIDIQ